MAPAPRGAAGDQTPERSRTERRVSAPAPMKALRLRWLPAVVLLRAMVHRSTGRRSRQPRVPRRHPRALQGCLASRLAPADDVGAQAAAAAATMRASG